MADSTPRTLAQHIAQTIDARRNCIKSGNSVWLARHTAFLQQLEKELPSGSGIDSGTTIDLDASTGERVVLRTAFHHMNDGGMYDGWTEHRVVVRASLYAGLVVDIGGRNRNGIKEYLSELFFFDLMERYSVGYDSPTDTYTIQRLPREAA